MFGHFYYFVGMQKPDLSFSRFFESCYNQYNRKYGTKSTDKMNYTVSFCKNT